MPEYPWDLEPAVTDDDSDLIDEDPPQDDERWDEGHPFGDGVDEQVAEAAADGAQRRELEEVLDLVDAHYAWGREKGIDTSLMVELRRALVAHQHRRSCTDGCA